MSFPFPDFLPHHRKWVLSGKCSSSPFRNIRGHNLWKCSFLESRTRKGLLFENDNSDGFVLSGCCGIFQSCVKMITWNVPAEYIPISIPTFPLSHLDFHFQILGNRCRNSAASAWGFCCFCGVCLFHKSSQHSGKAYLRERAIILQISLTKARNLVSSFGSLVFWVFGQRTKEPKPRVGFGQRSLNSDSKLAFGCLGFNPETQNPRPEASF